MEAESTTKTISQRVTEIIMKHLDVAEVEVTPGANLHDDLGADSLDQIELCMEIERQFNITISDEDAAEISTVEQLVTLIEQRLEFR